MRISDWSADVCSSDLVLPGEPQRRVAHHLYAEDGDISGEIEILPQGELRLPQERDYLTGLSNRRAAQKWIAQRLEGHEGTVLLLLSISPFDRHNAAYGTFAGTASQGRIGRRIGRLMEDETGGGGVMVAGG